MHQLDIMQSDIQDLKKMFASFGANNNTAPPIEIIDQGELAKRLNITKATVIAWVKRGRIPSIRIGASVRYNWPAVVSALEKR